MKLEPVWRSACVARLKTRERVVASADHGQHVAAGVVDGQQRALRAGVLLERGAARAALRGRGQADVDDVAGLGQRVAVALAGPLPVGGQKDNFRACLTAGPMRASNLERKRARDESMNVVAGSSGYSPVGMAIVIERARRSARTFSSLPRPAAPALVGGQAVGHGAIGRLLQVEIERGVDAQAGLVHLFGAEALFELAPHLFLEPGRDRRLRLRDAQAQRRLAGLLGLRRG